VAGKTKYPVSVGYSNVGCVEEAGGNIRGFAPGDRVMCQAGHVSRYSAGPEAMTKIPDEVTDAQAVYDALSREKDKTLAGERCLTTLMGPDFSAISPKWLL